jgi:hypothetical protein
MWSPAGRSVKDFLGCARSAGVLAFLSDFRRLGAYIYDAAATLSLTHLHEALWAKNIHIVALRFVRFGGRRVYHHRDSSNGALWNHFDKVLSDYPHATPKDIATM